MYRVETVEKRHQLGQSMVEYTVLLIALTAAMLTVSGGEYGHVGTRKSTPTEQHYQQYDRSLMQAVHQRYRAQSYGLRITELPELNVDGLSQYYNRLEKFPALSSEINKVAGHLNKVNQNFNDVNEGLSKLKVLKKRVKAGFKTFKKKVRSSLGVFKG